MLKQAVLEAILCGSAVAQGGSPCVRFSVVTQDALKNVNRGLSPENLKWFRDKIEKKNPSVCYASPGTNAPLVFVIIVTPDTFHGTRVVTNTESNPMNATITDENGNTATVSGQTSSTSSTAVPYSFQYGIYTLEIESRQNDGSFLTLHRFQQRGIYNTLYGIPLGGKGHHPLHTVIEEAAEWINHGGLGPEQAEARPTEPPVAQPKVLPASDPKTISGDAVQSAGSSPAAGSATLDFVSTPSGAEIEIDGAFVGNSPASVEVSLGTHVLRLSKKGFVPWERELKAMPGHANVNPELTPFEITPKPHVIGGPIGSKCSPAIETTIAGDFNGWEGETIFKLSNGQIWQQSEYEYMYSYSFMPEVTIYSTSEGCKLKVEDEEETITVKRIK